MSTSLEHRLRPFLLVPLLAATATAWASAPQTPPRPAAAEEDGVDAEEKRQEEAAKRFQSLLEKTPRKGTALDRVYGFHVERGTLDAFVKTYVDRGEAGPGDGVAWMIVGLVEGQRGRDAASVEAFRKAEAARPEDPLSSYYLGQALVLVGQPEEAASAFERALQRKPTRNDLLEIFQALGRVYQRAQKSEEALGVWKRLEDLFPNDPRVQEQIAAALAEEGQDEAALGRYEALAAKAADPFRRVQFGMQAADLKMRLGRSTDALADFEKLLNQLRPDSWLHREARRKIEEVFLRSDDRTGLAAYYEKWVEAHPDDVDAVVRLGRSLAVQGRTADSQKWFEKAVKLAPTRRDLRLALIGQFVQDQKFAEAAAQYQALDEASPNDPDVLRDWGGLILHDPSKPEAERKAAAGGVWRRMLAARPADPVVAAQVADLFRQADMPDDALALYRKAEELAPDDPQYHEYLGEYLHTLKRPEEAKAAWAKIAEPPRRNARNLTRMGEVLAGFGHLAESLGPLEEAVTLEPDEFALRLKFADLLHRASRFDEAEAQLDVAERLAEKDEERRAALTAQVKNDQAAGRLSERAETIRKEIGEMEAAGAPGSRIAERESRLALFLEADSKTIEAVAAVEKAVAADPQSVAAWSLAARLRDSTGDLEGAADGYRRLAEIDRRNRGEHLTGVARLEARLGRADEALKAGRELIAAAPGNPEGYQFYSELCFQLGRDGEGIDALRRAVRIDPNETRTALALAENLAGRYRTDEALEIYWKTFEKADDLDARVGMVSRLTELYLQLNQFDRLLTRLRGTLQDDQRQDRRRELTICLAQAYAASGDLGQARAELESVLSTDAHDPRLIQQIVKLSEEEGDFDAASKYQRQFVELAPSDEALSKLADLQVRVGELDEAQEIWSKLAAGKSQPEKVLAALDKLLANDRAAAALEVADALVRKDPRDWEAIYRQGVALAALKRPDEASARFRTLLGLRGTVGEDEKSAQAQARSRDPKLAGSTARNSTNLRIEPLAIQSRIAAINRIRMVTGIETRAVYGAMQPPWAPQDFGQARIAALGWLLGSAMAEHKEEEMLAGFRESKDRTPADPDALWDWYWIDRLRFEFQDAYRTALALGEAAPSDPEAAWTLLVSTNLRNSNAGRQVHVLSGRESVDQTPPLPPEEIDLLLKCYDELRRRRPEMADSNVAQILITELKQADRDADADRIYHQAVESAVQPLELALAMTLAAQRGDAETIETLASRFERTQSTSSPYLYSQAQARAQAAGMLLADKKPEEALRVLDRQLEANRRLIQNRPAGKSKSASTSSLRYLQSWNGRSTQSVQSSMPFADDWLDASALSVVRTVYDGYKRLDLSSDLTAHLQEFADAAETDLDAILRRLALAYVLWWDDEKDAAISMFTAAVDRAGTDQNLRLTFADLLESRGDPAEALDVVDAVQPRDNATTQRREEQALRLAVQIGDLERARTASERLFGLRLDTDAQIRLAGQMGRLGLTEMAEAVLNRARRRVGNKAGSLVGLMLQYQQQQQTDTAVQVAQQILRTTSSITTGGAAAASMIVSSGTTSASPEQARNAAIQVLARSGKLDDLVARAREQLKAMPNSVQLHQTLADYHLAAGRRDEARDELLKMVELRPDDAALRCQVAARLVSDGKPELAVEQYREALQRDPSVLGRYYSPIMNAYRSVDKSAELTKLLESTDLRSLGGFNTVVNMIQGLSFDPKQKDVAAALFRRAWEAFPTERANIMAYLHRDEFWKLPEMFDYAVEVAIPDAATTPDRGGWRVFNSVVSFKREGQIEGLVSRLLDLADSQNRNGELTKKLEAAVEQSSNWAAGKAMLAMAQCRAGAFDAARGRVEEILTASKDDPLVGYGPQILGSELEKYVQTRDLAVRMLEEGVKAQRNNPGGLMSQFEYSPLRRLIGLYVHDDRKEDARRILLEASRERTSQSFFNEDYEQQMRMQTLSTVGRELLTLGFAADAAPILNEARARIEASPAGASSFIGDLDALLKTTNDALETAMQSLKGEGLAATEAFIRPPEEGAKAGAAPRVDMALMVHPRQLDEAAIRSLLGDSIASAASDPNALRAIDERLAAVQRAAPDDLAAATASTLSALAGGKPETIRPALDSLKEMLAKTPLEPLAAGVRANARQRAEAMRRLPLWLVVRACRKSPEWSADADAIGAVALEAAHRVSDPIWRLAMLREQGAQAMARGDRDAAEAAWSRMLDAVLAVDAIRKKPEAAKPAPPRSTIGRISMRPQDATAPAVATPPGAPPVRPSGGSSLLTVERFDQAMQVAKLAAENGMFDLSARAVRESLRGGPPAVVNAGVDPRRTHVVIRNGSPVAPVDPVIGRVAERLLELDSIWKRGRAPADRIHDALREAVAPGDRPDELFLYLQPIAGSRRLQTHSVAAILAEWAALAGKTDELLQEVEKRGARPSAALPALVLKARIALAAGRDPELVEALTAIRDRLKTNTLRESAEMSIHAALPALDRPAALPRATEIMEAAARSLTAESENLGYLGPLLLTTARRSLSAGDSEAGRRVLDAYLEAMKGESDARNNGDYALYLYKNLLSSVTSEYARAGEWAAALEHLGRYVDAPSYSGGDPDVGGALRRTLSAMDSVPAPARYETLRAWTLPTESRQLVRDLASPVRESPPPPPFTTLAGPTAAEPVASTATALIRAATEAGKLDELLAETRTAADRKWEGAEPLHRLVALAAGRFDQVSDALEARRAELAAEIDAPRPEPTPDGSRKPTRFPWFDYLTATEAVRSPEARALGRGLAEALEAHARRVATNQGIIQLRSDLAAMTADDAGAPALHAPAVLNAPLWHSAPAFGLVERRPTSLWIADRGLLAHVAATSQDRLTFEYPLQGSFEVSFDAFQGPWANAIVGFGAFDSTPAMVQTFDPAKGVSSRTWSHTRSHDFDHVVIRVTPDSQQLFINGHRMRDEDAPNPAVPWLSLSARAGHRTVWKNLEFKGTPTIPREVKLVHADRLEGWFSPLRDEILTRPKPKDSAASPLSTTAPYRNPEPSQDPNDYDWSAVDGVIQGRKLPSTGSIRNIYGYPQGMPTGASPEAVQSMLSYSRPLLEGDVLTYAFRYEPGEVMVHPALGRTVFLMEPDGVRLHWVTSAFETFGISAANAVDVPEHRRGDGPIPLKADDWNEVAVKIAEGKARLELNGRLVYEHPLPPEETQRFGLYHEMEQTSARVRDVTLKGRWPESLSESDRAALAFRTPAADRPEAERLAIHALIGEEFLCRAAGEVLAATASLPAEARSKALADWVLPAPDHPVFRLQGEVATADPAPTVAATADSQGPRAHAGGEVRIPAVAMVDAAAEAGKLDELAARLDAAPVADDEGRRGRLAILAILATAKDDPDAADAAFAELKPLLQAAPIHDPGWSRWPELAAASAALDRKTSVPAALSLLDLIATRAEGRKDQDWWSRIVDGLRTRALLATTDAASPAADAPGSTWASASQATALDRGRGVPPARWIRRGGDLVHLPGRDQDHLYLTTPITGDFQVDCELTSFGLREARITYGGLGIGPRSDLKSVDRFTIGGARTETALDPPLDPPGDWFAYRLVVQGDRASAFVNGRRILESPLPSGGLPWLTIHADHAATGGVRNLKISGAAVVPDRIDLLPSSELAGWFTGYPDQTQGGEDGNWSRRGDEIIGRLDKEFPGSKTESVLVYGRPLVEDGEIAYDFYYDPGKTAVHPALDRLTFLLEPGGVRTHWMTDGAEERTGLDPANADVDPDARRGPPSPPFKPQDWNRVVVKLVGDLVTIRLNDVEIYARTLEPTNQRMFGLFHYSDETEVRVRNLSHVGAWPKALPAELVGEAASSP